MDGIIGIWDSVFIAGTGICQRNEKIKRAGFSSLVLVTGYMDVSLSNPILSCTVETPTPAMELKTTLLMQEVKLQLTQKPYGFTATDQFGSIVTMDNVGTQNPNFGVSPMQCLLMALAACTSIDVVMILEKQKQNIETYTVTVRGEKEKTGEFSLWRKIEIDFNILGAEPLKAERAVELSINKYCSVAETLRRAGAIITYQLHTSL